MNCPSCDHEIAPAQVHGETTDTCEACGGIWIETGELRPFVERILERDPEFAADAEVPTDFPLAGTFYKTGRDCPVCAQQMEKIYYAYDSGVRVEHCVPCGGTWIEASRLEQLAAHLRNNADPVPRAGGVAEFTHADARSNRHRVPQMSPAAGLFLAAVCYIVLMYASYNVVQLLVVLQSDRESQSWIEYPATLDDITIRQDLLESSRSQLPVYAVRRYYTYNIRGTYYQGHATWPNGDDWMTDDALTERLAVSRFVPNEPITVFIDPDDPARSSLRRGVNPYRNTNDLRYYIIIAVLSAAGLVYTTWKVVQLYRGLEETS